MTWSSNMVFLRNPLPHLWHMNLLIPSCSTSLCSLSTCGNGNFLLHWSHSNWCLSFSWQWRYSLITYMHLFVLGIIIQHELSNTFWHVMKSHTSHICEVCSLCHLDELQTCDFSAHASKLCCHREDIGLFSCHELSLCEFLTWCCWQRLSHRKDIGVCHLSENEIEKLVSFFSWSLTLLKPWSNWK